MERTNHTFPLILLGAYLVLFFLAYHLKVFVRGIDDLRIHPCGLQSLLLAGHEDALDELLPRTTGAHVLCPQGVEHEEPD